LNFKGEVKEMKKAFTLIELLVVIAIIAILAAILFPVFAQAKQAAKKTSALSAVKQMGTAVQLYIADNDDVYPMGSGACWWQPLDGGWTIDTQPYVKNLELLRDPTDPKQKTGWPGWLKTHANGINISFVSNGYIGWDNASSSNKLLGVMGLNQAVPANAVRSDCSGYAPWMSVGIRNGTEVSEPSATIAFTERFGSNITWGVSNNISGQDWWDWTGFPGLLPDGTRNGNPYEFTANGDLVKANPDNRDGAVSAPYAKKAVFSMCDSSAKVMSPARTNPDPNNKPNENMWNAQR
jgi:prepilin-type N-terminal cleavage/methylation domain-containing protein